MTLHQVEHSGYTWTALSVSPRGLPLWPIEEMLARRKFSHSVTKRIRHFYPKGKEEGSLTRGVFYKPLSWRRAKRLFQLSAPRHRFQRFRRKGNHVIWNAWEFDGMPPEFSDASR